MHWRYGAATDSCLSWWSGVDCSLVVCTQLALLARLGYYLLTTVSGMKTLGEEHTGLLRVLFVKAVIPGTVAAVHAATYLGAGRK